MAINPISRFRDVLGRYPGNNKVWWVAKSQSDDPDKGIKAGDFLPDILDKSFTGNTRVPRGHYILDAFAKDRSAVSGIPGFNKEILNYRPISTCFFAGRVWWAAKDKVYYSQLIDHKSKAGLCFQEADPTSEDVADLIATDGGVVPLLEAKDIQRISPLSNGVMVFSTTGVWFISSGDSSFSATELAVSKVSGIGTNYPNSILLVGDRIFWWSEVGIHALEQASGQFGPIPGKFGNDNIAEQTIQSFYNNIPQECKKRAQALYDSKNNVVKWCYGMDETLPRRFTHVLNFDLTLNAFYPWKFSTAAGLSPVVRGMFSTEKLLSNEILDPVVDNANNPVTTAALAPVTVSIINTVTEDKPTNVNYVTEVGGSITFSQVDNRNFVDWQSHDSLGTEYLSFMETGYELLEDAMRKKQTPRVFVHFRRTEDDPSEPPSSCTFRAKWDWTANSGANRWSRAIEAYRPVRMRIPSGSDFESGMPVVISKNVVRGSGKSVQFRFECSDAGKNFDLLGWAVAYAGNTRP